MNSHPIDDLCTALEAACDAASANKPTDPDVIKLIAFVRGALDAPVSTEFSARVLARRAESPDAYDAGRRASRAVWFQ